VVIALTKNKQKSTTVISHFIYWQNYVLQDLVLGGLEITNIYTPLNGLICWDAEIGGKEMDEKGEVEKKEENHLQFCTAQS